VKGTFEETLAELEARVAALSRGDLSLEEALRAFEEGLDLYRECAARLREAELKVTELTEAAEGETVS